MRNAEHYLLTYELIPGLLRMHAYLATIDKSRLSLEAATERLIDEADKFAEKEKFKIFMPIILSTKLTTGKEIVRDIVFKHYPEAKKTMKTAKEVYFTVWAWSVKDNPDDDRLMELH